MSSSLPIPTLFLLETVMKYFILAFLLVGTPLPAQSWELGLFAGQQSYRNSNFPGMPEEYEVKSKIVTGARLGYRLWEFGPASVQVTAGFQPKSESVYLANGFDMGLKYQHEHTSVGAMVNFNAVMPIGIGIEYRMEKLNLTSTGWSDASYNRPWFRATMSHIFETATVRPFIGLEAAAPLTSHAYAADSGMDSFLRSLAPKFQLGLYGGIRF
jgi:hypothetical protein